MTTPSTINVMATAAFKEAYFIPSLAGIYTMRLMALCYGFPPQPALECFSRGRERQCWY